MPPIRSDFHNNLPLELIIRKIRRPRPFVRQTFQTFRRVRQTFWQIRRAFRRAFQRLRQPFRIVRRTRRVFWQPVKRVFLGADGGVGFDGADGDFQLVELFPLSVELFAQLAVFNLQPVGALGQFPFETETSSRATVMPICVSAVSNRRNSKS